MPHAVSDTPADQPVIHALPADIRARLQPLYTAEAIAERVADLGRLISEYYRGEPMVVVCVLKGGVLFFADLARHITSPLEMDFVRLSSYGNATVSSDKLLFTKDVEVDVADKHVLLVEDIVDTGRSMKYLTGVLQQRGPASVEIAALLDKNERRVEGVDIRFAGFQLDKGFVVGYGLDFAEQYRNLPGVYELLPE